jgi:hypothetical protein
MLKHCRVWSFLSISVLLSLAKWLDHSTNFHFMSLGSYLSCQADLSLVYFLFITSTSFFSGVVVVNLYRDCGDKDPHPSYKGSQKLVKQIFSPCCDQRWFICGQMTQY